MSFIKKEWHSESSLPPYFYSIQHPVFSKSRIRWHMGVAPTQAMMWLRPTEVQNWNKMTMARSRHYREKVRRSNPTMVLQHQTRAIAVPHTRYGLNIVRSLSVRCSRAPKKSNDSSLTTKMKISRWRRPCKQGIPTWTFYQKAWVLCAGGTLKATLLITRIACVG